MSHSSYESGGELMDLWWGENEGRRALTWNFYAGHVTQSQNDIRANLGTLLMLNSSSNNTDSDIMELINALNRCQPSWLACYQNRYYEHRTSEAVRSDSVHAASSHRAYQTPSDVVLPLLFP